MAQVLHKQGTVQVGELELNVICSYFGDRAFLLITHLNKIGTLLEVSRDSILGTTSTTYSVKTLLGKDEAEVHVYARAIAATLPLPPDTPLLLALGLQKHTPSTLSALLPKIKQFRIWDT